MVLKSYQQREESITLAIDRDKESHNALKWAVDNLLTRGQTLTLLHVKLKQPTSLPYSGSNPNRPGDDVTELFLPFHCYCARKDINCRDVVVEDINAAKGIVEYVQNNAVETLILGSSKSLLRFKVGDVSSAVMKKAPSFCDVYVIAKGKISSLKTATSSPPRSTMLNQNVDRKQQTMQSTQDEIDLNYPFSRRGQESTYQSSMTDSDISLSSGRPSVDQMFPSLYDNVDIPRFSISSEYEENRSSFAASQSSGKQSIDLGSSYGAFSSSSLESGRQSCSSQDEIEAEMKRLKMELKYTMEMYSNACKEIVSAKKTAIELHKWKTEKEQKLAEVRLAKEAAIAMAESEKEKSRAAMEAAMAAQRIAELEAQKRKHFEIAEEKKRVVSSLEKNDIRYRKYKIEEIEEAAEDFVPSRKIGEGGYGPVYKGTLDFTEVAIKVLKPDAAQGMSQFQQEVEVLTRIRHPNMVLLLGACPEFGCLVYEYMANGSLEDCLFGRGNSPILSWQLRFRIAAEIATCLHFLHQMKPEPLVHRDLKPANILLDHHFVSKISDVGLARLVPPPVADTTTQYRMTATAGTFCYIDPEYQQTGMLGTKSDIYSFGIVLLQILTAKPPMGLTPQVEEAIENGTFEEMLDPAVPDWPIEEALVVAKLGIQCAELRKKDRPHLGNTILPELNRLKALAEESINLCRTQRPSRSMSSVSTTSRQEIISDPQLRYVSRSSSLHSSFGS